MGQTRSFQQQRQTLLLFDWVEPYVIDVCPYFGLFFITKAIGVDRVIRKFQRMRCPMIIKKGRSEAVFVTASIWRENLSRLLSND